MGKISSIILTNGNYKYGKDIKSKLKMYSKEVKEE